MTGPALRGPADRQHVERPLRIPALRRAKGAPSDWSGHKPPFSQRVRERFGTRLPFADVHGWPFFMLALLVVVGLGAVAALPGPRPGGRPWCIRTGVGEWSAGPGPDCHTHRA